MGGSFEQIEPWIRLLTGSLLAGGLFAAAFLSLRWWLQQRTVFHLLVTILMLCGALLSLLAPFRYTEGWIIQLILVALTAGSFWLLAERHPELKSVVLSAGLVAITGSLILSALLFWGRQDLTNESLRQRLDDTVAALNEETTRLENSAAELSGSTIVDSILAGATDETTSQLARLLVENQLNGITVITNTGIVLARAGQSATHDNVLVEHPWLLTVLKNEPLSGRVINRVQQPELVAAVPVMRQSRLVGALMVSKEIADQFLNELPAGSLAVGTTFGLAGATATNPDEIKLLQSADIDALIRQEAVPHSGPYRFARRVTVDETSYRLSGLVLDSLSQSPVVFLTTSIPAQPLRSPFFAWLIAVVAMTGAAALAAFLTSRHLEKKGGSHA